MARNKYPVHTTLSHDAIKVLERYEKELGAKNLVLEKALLSLDTSRFKSKLDTQNLDRAIKRISTGVAGLDDMLEGGDPRRFFGGGDWPSRDREDYSLHAIPYGGDKKRREMYPVFLRGKTRAACPAFHALQLGYREIYR
jgi:hypothetical protein